MKKTSAIILVIIILIIVVIGVYFLKNNTKGVKPETNQPMQNVQIQPAQNQNNQTSNNFSIQGMQIEITKQGSGDPAKSGDLVTVNYTGTLSDGTKFDSSVDPSFNHVTPFQFTLGQNRVIQGWELGVLGMKVGEERKLTIPPELAYGSSGAGGLIPPNAILTFVIDLFKIN